MCSEVNNNSMNMESTYFLSLSTETLRKMTDSFKSELRSGLEMDGSMLKALPSYVDKKPTGEEKGVFLVVDLGGSNLRVGCVHLNGNGNFQLKRNKWSLDPHITQSSGEVLFDFIAEKIKEFISSEFTTSPTFTPLPQSLGFVFSYPVQQEYLAHGILIQWNKAVQCNDVIGRDVVQLLEDALKRAQLGNIKVKALLNDTVGTLLAHSYIDPSVKMGVIVGTGTNAAYFESIANIPKLSTKSNNMNSMIINIEWGAFGEGNSFEYYLPLTQIDRILDEESVNPGKQLFEKMISGLYLGEIGRLLLLEKFPDISIKFSEKFSLDTSILSALRQFPDQVDSLLCLKTNSTQREVILNICHSVVKRSAMLCAAGICGVYEHLDMPETFSVAFDGSLYEHYPDYRTIIAETLDSLLPPNNRSIKLLLAKDESIVGAAVALAIDSNQPTDVS